MTSTVASGCWITRAHSTIQTLFQYHILFKDAQNIINLSARSVRRPFPRFLWPSTFLWPLSAPFSELLHLAVHTGGATAPHATAAMARGGSCSRAALAAAGLQCGLWCQGCGSHARGSAGRHAMASTRGFFGGNGGGAVLSARSRRGGDA